MIEDERAISGATAGLRLMADSTVRVTIDFEPKDREAVMKLLGNIGQPVGVVALKAGHAAVREKPKDDRGPLCMEAIRLCSNEAFQTFINTETSGKWVRSAHAAKAFILARCGIDSRKELDGNKDATAHFNILCREFQGWLKREDQ